MDVPVVVRRGGVGRWQEGGTPGHFSDRPRRLRQQALRYSIRRDRQGVGAVRGVGFGGQRCVCAAGVAECIEGDERVSHSASGLQTLAESRRCATWRRPIGGDERHRRHSRRRRYLKLFTASASLSWHSNTVSSFVIDSRSLMRLVVFNSFKAPPPLFIVA